MQTNAGSWVWDIFPLETLNIVPMFSCYQLSLKLLSRRYHFKNKQKKQIKPGVISSQFEETFENI